MSPERENAAGKAEAPSQISRNVAIASGATIVALIGYLAFAAWGDRSPAVIAFEVVTSEGWTEGSAAYVPVDVRNAGGQTAAEIEVETSFQVVGAEQLVKRTTIDFLAGGETSRFYAVGPPGAPLTVRLIGFQEP